MAKIVVDLGAVAVPNEHRVYKCFPGQSYRYYRVVTESHAVFLDIYGLPSLGSDPMQWDHSELFELIRESRVREDERLNKRRPGRQQRSAKASNRLDHRYFNMAIGLYQTAQAGDLVVVPAEGYDKDVYIGEILGGPLREISIPGDADRLDQHFYARPVAWLDQRPKTKLSSELVSLLHTPVAFFDLGRSKYEEIYRAAYQNFIYDDVSFSTFDTSKDKFRNYDNLVSSLWLEYLIAAGVARFDTDKSVFQTLSLLDATSKEWSHTLGEELYLNINSPGTIGVRAVGLFPLVALALWALTSVDARAPFDKEVETTVRRITHASPGCEVAVSQELKEYLQTIGYDRWKEACEVANRMRIDAKISTKSSIR